MQNTGTQGATPGEVDVLWITAGLGCDGDTISMTAATQPSLEDILGGIIPGIPKVNLYNPVLAYENGMSFSGTSARPRPAGVPTPLSSWSKAPFPTSR